MIIGLTALALIMGLLGRYVAKEKNRSGLEGFLFGFFLSILGIIIVALLPTIEKEEPVELELTDEQKKLTKKERNALYALIVVLLVLFLIIVLALSS